MQIETVSHRLLVLESLRYRVHEGFGGEVMFRQDLGEAQSLEPACAHRLLGFTAFGKGDQHGTAVGLQYVAYGIVTCLGDRKPGTCQKGWEIWPEGKNLNIGQRAKHLGLFCGQ